MKVAIEPSELVTATGPLGVMTEVPMFGSSAPPKNSDVTEAGDSPIAMAKPAG